MDSVFLEVSSKTLPIYKEKAHASYYHDRFNGKRTASGVTFDNDEFTAAHKKIPFGTKVKVTNIANNKWVVVTITDRGPYSKGREIDLSKAAFKSIARNKDVGVMIVNLQIIKE
ncbi:septal ring lytic transglycosylase RlpA family protein [Flavobacterium jejuense]|uniref:Probable endolytic peptidoglycan transglycosylase RlpA n=2 Tax=Flavobacterium jejuense TaxID=1544455 RepID=A0ABX0IUG9_9FLAO|nr:septal ring lytic transglycosylase RlpA family protein [Flavobacterium jejuense]